MLYGDIPKEHLELAKDLLEMEAFFLENENIYPPAEIAKGLLCLSRDWYSIGDEDKGSELIEKASKICPGYFENEIGRHIEEDELYAVLVEDLATHIIEVAKSILEGRNGKN